VGWEYDAMEEICQRINCTVNWNITAWDTMISAVREGQFDVGMDGISITDERKQQVDFSDPYLRSEQFMLVRADEARFDTPEAFAADPELLIGSQAGTTNFYAAVYSVLDGDEANPRIKLFDTFGASVQALLMTPPPARATSVPTPTSCRSSVDRWPATTSASFSRPAAIWLRPLTRRLPRCCKTAS